MGQRRSFKTFLITFTLIFMLGMSIEVFSQVINSLRATNTSQLVVDNNTNGLADGGDIIEYTVQIANCSPNSIGGVNYQSDIDPNTVLIPNSITVTTQNTTLCGGGNNNPPAPTPLTPPPHPHSSTTTPANGATEVALNSNVTITFSEAVTVAGNWVQMVCTISGTFDTLSANLTITGGPITYTLDPNVDLQVGETCAVTVFASQVTDSEGINPTSNYAFGFVTETPPTITATNPANGAVAVPPASDIVITFDEPVTVTAASFTLECPAGTPFAGGFAVTGSGTNIITINPSGGNLPSGITCQVVVVAANVSDLDANDPPDLLDGNNDNIEGDDYTFSFTTDVDAAPTVISITPANGAVSVASNTNITITFSELVDITSAANFSVECPAGTPQGYTVITPATLPASTTTVVIDPASLLPDATLCTVTVFTSVTDSDTDDPPDNMTANFVSTFTTEAPPNVTTTTPANGATTVSTGANIIVDFDEPVDVTTSSFTIECPAGGTSYSYTIAGSGTNSITLDPTTSLLANQTCTVTVIAAQVNDSDPIDPPQNMPANYVFSFDTVADTAPTANSPLDGVTGVATGSNIVINFNEPVDVTAGAFVVECPVGTPVAFVTIPALPTTNQTSITIDPSGNLPATTTCAVSVLQANVTDTDTDEPPNNMVADYNFTFDTLVDLAPTVDQPNIVPASISSVPNTASLINPVSTTPTITIPFSEAVTVATGGFTLTCNATPVTVTITPALPATATSFDVSPSAPIAQGANCILTVVAANVTDADVDDPPNLMVADYTVTFNIDTAPSETLTQTEVGNVFQNVTGAGATNVDLDSDIQITFTEAVTVTFPANGLQCPAGNIIPVTVTTNNATTIVLNPDINLPLNTACVLAIPAGNISDVDTSDAPDNPALGVNHTFQTVDDDAPTVSTNPTAGGSNIAVNSNITVTFNEPVTLTGAWFDLTCSVSGSRTSTGELTGTGIFIIENTPDLVYTIDPAVDLATGDVCTITIDSANAVDNDIIDGPNELDGNASA
ncbi:MAG: Ig-like domain-containing protein, partial [bacterium]|nr:Ig-like domain-containing protein [bacterium]